jgi:hypothetical protein
MLKRSAILLVHALLLVLTLCGGSPSSVSARVTDKPDKPLVIVLVNSSIYPQIASSLEQYGEDVQSGGFSVRIVGTDELADATPRGVRGFLQQAFIQGLVGAVLVGDIPTAWFKVSDKILPTDMYYRDLNGVWTDLDGDGVYERHSGDVSPEIWVGRLKASGLGGDESLLLNEYFNKNHRFRLGLRVLPWWRALAYIDDDGIDWAGDANSSLRQACSDVTLVTDPTVTTAVDYMKRLQDPFGYEWLYLMCHGDFDYHTFKTGGSSVDDVVYPYEYRSIDPRVLFYIMFVCSGARFTENNYLAGTSIFGSTYGLLSISCTDTMYSFSFRDFFTALSQGEAIGSSFQELFLREDGLQGQHLDNTSYQFVFYGLTLNGDPTLKPCVRREVKLHDVSITDATYNITELDGGSAVHVKAFVQNPGDFDETFHVSIRTQYYTLADSMVSLAPKSDQIVELYIKKPYGLIPVNNTNSTVSVILNSLPEEFNIANNVNYLVIKGVVIVPPSTSFNANRLEWLITTLVLFSLVPYGVFKVLTSERLFLSKYPAKLRGVLARNRH